MGNDISEFTTPSEPQEPDAKVRIKALERELKRLKKLVDGAHGLERVIIKAVEDVLSDPLDISVPTPPPPPIDTRSHYEEAALHLSDTQIGKITKSYDSAVASERIRRLGHHVKQIVRDHKQHHRVSKLHLLLGGDMVEGELIFPHQAHLIDSPVIDQAIHTAPIAILALINDILESVEQIHVECVIGNHGRPAHKHAGSHPKTNWDRVMYEVLKLLIERSAPLCERVTINIADGWYSTDLIAGNRYLMVHGDQIRGGFAGYPWYGVGRKAMKWSTAFDFQFNYLFLGHFHTWAAFDVNSITVLANGTTESDNEFALEMLGGSGRPCQRLAFFSPTKGLVADHKVYLDE